MRITTGKHKGRVLARPLGIRPTQNKVRKAIFDILGDISGMSFLELFAGSGAVGFEAVSRGVTALVLVEDNRDCLEAINKNIKVLQPLACDIYPLQAEVAIERLAAEKRQFDLIFLDPPYTQGQAKKTLQTLSAYDILAANGLVIIQHSKKEDLPPSQGKLQRIKQSKYSDTILSMYRQ